MPSGCGRGERPAFKLSGGLERILLLGVGLCRVIKFAFTCLKFFCSEICESGLLLVHLM